MWRASATQKRRSDSAMTFLSKLEDRPAPPRAAAACRFRSATSAGLDGRGGASSGFVATPSQSPTGLRSTRPTFPKIATAPTRHDENSFFIGEFEKFVTLDLALEPNCIQVHILNIL